MPNPQNSILGGFNMPTFESTAPEVDTSDQKLTAKFATTKGWKQQKEYLQSRIEHWQHFLPGNPSKPINEASKEERAQHMVDADNIIREINQWVLQVEGILDGVRNTEA